MGKRRNHTEDLHMVGRSGKALRARLERTAVRDRDLDRQVAEDWANVDQENFDRWISTEPLCESMHGPIGLPIVRA